MMIYHIALKYSVLELFLLMFFFAPFFCTTYAQEDNLTKNSNNALDKNDKDSVVNQLIQVIGVLGSVALGTFGTRYIVNKWQQQKETSEIRKEILRNYQKSIKDYVVLMETFVARIVFGLLSTKNEGVRLKELDKSLPFGYTYNPLDYTVKEVQNQILSLSDINENDCKEFIKTEFRKLKMSSLTKEQMERNLLLVCDNSIKMEKTCTIS